MLILSFQKNASKGLVKIALCPSSQFPNEGSLGFSEQTILRDDNSTFVRCGGFSRKRVNDRSHTPEETTEFFF